MSVASARPALSLVPPGRAVRPRRWSLVAIALLITVGSALAFVVLWMRAGGREPVLALRRDVAAGETIEAQDLTVVRVAADPGVEQLPASVRGDVVGRPAATDLLAGSLLVEAAVGRDPGLEPGSAVVAVPLPVGEIPTADLHTGDRLLLYRAGAEGGIGSGSGAETIGDGRIFAIEASDEGGADVRVSVVVDEGLVPEIAAAIQSDEMTVALAATRR